MRSDTTHTSKLRAWRIENDLTLADVAGLTGLAVAVLSRVERGLTRLRPMTKVKVARALGVPVRDLFDPETDIVVTDEDLAAVSA